MEVDRGPLVVRLDHIRRRDPHQNIVEAVVVHIPGRHSREPERRRGFHIDDTPGRSRKQGHIPAGPAGEQEERSLDGDLLIGQLTGDLSAGIDVEHGLRDSGQLVGGRHQDIVVAVVVDVPGCRHGQVAGERLKDLTGIIAGNGCSRGFRHARGRSQIYVDTAGTVGVIIIPIGRLCHHDIVVAVVIDITHGHIVGIAHVVAEQPVRISARIGEHIECPRLTLSEGY